MDKSKSDLPGDVEVDGECVALPGKDLKQFGAGRLMPHSKSVFANRDLDNLKEKDLISGDFDSRNESGYGSIGQASLKSSGSLSHSVGSKPEPHTDRTPVQCSENKDDSSLTDINSRLSDLNVHDDEGIDSIKSVDQSQDTSVPECVYDDFDLEQEYLEQDGDGDTILHTSIVSEMISLVMALINLCPSVACLNVQNKLFQTPLHVAVLTNLSDIVRRLVRKGADIMQRDQQGNTALHIACRTGNKDIVETIVESAKSNPNRLHKLFTMKNSEGLTCLHIAAEKKHYIIMGYLFANGADVNMGDAKSGRTILHYAVERKDEETLKILLTYKDIDIDCVTYKGESPLVIAYWRNYQDIVKKLKSKGAYFSFDLVADWEDEEAS